MSKTRFKLTSPNLFDRFQVVALTDDAGQLHDLPALLTHSVTTRVHPSSLRKPSLCARRSDVSRSLSRFSFRAR